MTLYAVNSKSAFSSNNNRQRILSSMKIEKRPIRSGRKTAVQDWLMKKGEELQEQATRAQLLEVAKKRV